MALSEIPPPHKNDIPMSQKDKELLGIADTIHDTKHGYRQINNPESKPRILEYLLQFMKKRTPQFSSQTQLCGLQNDLSSYLTRCLADNSTITVGDVEDLTMSYFEQEKSLETVPVPISYEDVLAQPEVLIEEGSDHVILSSSTISIKALKDVDKLKLADAILKYMFPEKYSEDIPVQFTFDAKAGVLGKIFRNHPNVCNMIVPANICDSAPTSFKKFGQLENIYPFISSFGQTNRLISARNYFSMNKGYRLIYENMGYGDNHVYQFNYKIKNGPLETLHASPSSAEPSGPSLDYLLQLHLEAGSHAQFMNIKSASSCLLIARRFIEGLTASVINDRDQQNAAILLDLKRCGDQDQVDSARGAMDLFGNFVILSTIDRLCALAARLKGVPCIYNFNETLHLYRSEIKENLSPALKEAFIYKKKKKSLSNFITMFLENINQNLMDNFLVFRESVIAELKKLIETYVVPKFNTMSYASMITEYLRIEHARSMITYIDTLITKVNGILSNEYFIPLVTEEHRARLNGLNDAFYSGASIEEIHQSYQYIDGLTQLMNNVMKFMNSESIQFTTLVNAAKMLKERNIFTFNTVHSFVNYNKTLYNNLMSSMIALERGIINASQGKERNGKINFVEILENSEKGYNILVENTIICILDKERHDALLEQFIIRPTTGQWNTQPINTAERTHIRERFEQISSYVKGIILPPQQPLAGGARRRRHYGGNMEETIRELQERVALEPIPEDRDLPQMEFQEMMDVLHTIANDACTIITSRSVDQFPITHMYIQINKFMHLFNKKPQSNANQPHPMQYHLTIQKEYIHKLFIDYLTNPHVQEKESMKHLAMMYLRLIENRITPEIFNIYSAFLCKNEVVNELQKTNGEFPHFSDQSIFLLQNFMDRAVYLWDMTTISFVDEDLKGYASVILELLSNASEKENTFEAGQYLLQLAVINDIIEHRIPTEGYDIRYPITSFVDFIFRVFREMIPFEDKILTILKHVNPSLPIYTAHPIYFPENVQINIQPLQYELQKIGISNVVSQFKQLLTGRPLPLNWNKPPTNNNNNSTKKRRQRDPKAGPSEQNKTRKKSETYIQELQKRREERIKAIIASPQQQHQQQSISVHGGNRNKKRIKNKTKKQNPRSRYPTKTRKRKQRK